MTFYGYKRSFIVGEFHVVCCGVLITETVCYRGKETLHSNLAHVNLISNKWRFQTYFSETVVENLTEQLMRKNGSLTLYKCQLRY